MASRLKAAVIACFLILGTAFYFVRSDVTNAQTDEPYRSANQQQKQFPTNIGLDCASCHGAGKALPNLAGEQFHKDAHGALGTSIHAKVGPNGRPAASCLDCHTKGGDMTTVVPAGNPLSTVNRSNIPQTCGACHQAATNTFHLSIHGTRQDNGDIHAASCADCHGSHGILPASDRHSMLNRATAGAACAACHTTHVADYQASSHGMALTGGNANAPSCATCHTAVSHAEAPLTTRDFSLKMIDTCGSCHVQQAPSYRDTFHGQATAHGFLPAATSADCHTPHRNLPASNPLSSVHPNKLVQTCSSCHTNANANFATYSPHPEPNNPEKSSLVYYVSHFMEVLLISVFSFFGLHTALWLQRSVVAYFSEKHEKTEDDKQYVTRFARAHRFTHLLIVVSFLGLAATGLPLMYYYTEWGQTLVHLHGGLEVTRFLHRVCAGITLVYATYHMYFIVKKAVFERKYSILYGPNSMMIRKQDLIDVFNMFKWFLYLGPRPRLDRWTYWEKFDYFAVFWGIPVIGLSGLMLWFPTFFTSFLPGVVLNVAVIVHGEEALLATAFIFSFHFFHNHLRPENFPMDVVIFTGKMTMARFKDERAVEYERLVREGKLHTIMTNPPSRFAQIASRIFGFAAYITGLIMVIAIFVTLLTTKH